MLPAVQYTTVMKPYFDRCKKNKKNSRGYFFYKIEMYVSSFDTLTQKAFKKSSTVHLKVSVKMTLW